MARSSGSELKCDSTDTWRATRPRNKNSSTRQVQRRLWKKVTRGGFGIDTSIEYTLRWHTSPGRDEWEVKKGSHNKRR